MSLRMKNATGKAALLQWCREQTSGYKNVNVQNFTTSWCDGLAFCALLHSFDPTLINFDSLKPENKMENVRLAFEAAERLGITRLLDVEDVADIPVPEPLSMMTYISQLYHYHAAHTTRVIGQDGHRRTPSSPPTMEEARDAKARAVQTATTGAELPRTTGSSSSTAASSSASRPAASMTGSLRGNVSSPVAAPTETAAPKLNRTQSSIADLVSKRKAENAKRDADEQKRKKEEYEKQQQKEAERHRTPMAVSSTSPPSSSPPVVSSITTSAASSASVSAASPSATSPPAKSQPAASSSATTASSTTTVSASKPVVSSPATSVTQPSAISAASSQQPSKSPRRTYSQSDIKAPPTATPSVSAASTATSTATSVTSPPKPIVTTPAAPRTPEVTREKERRADEERRKREERWKSLFDRETQEQLQQQQAAQQPTEDAIIVKCLDDGSMFKLSSLDQSGKSFNGFTGTKKPAKSPEVVTEGKCSIM